MKLNAVYHEKFCIEREQLRRKNRKVNDVDVLPTRKASVMAMTQGAVDKGEHHVLARVVTVVTGGDTAWEFEALLCI